MKKHIWYTWAEYTHHMEQNDFTADLLFDWFGFDHASKTVVKST